MMQLIVHAENASDHCLILYSRFVCPQIKWSSVWTIPPMLGIVNARMNG